MGAAADSSAGSTSAAKKQRCVLDEQCWILEQGAMARVRVKDELGVRQVLRKNVGVDRWDHRVIVALHDENRLFDLAQTRVALTLRRAPCLVRDELGTHDLNVAWRIAILLARPEPSQKGPACRLACFRRREEEKELILWLCLFLRGNRLDRRREPVHPLATPWAGSYQDHTANQVRTVQRHLLGHQAAYREAEQVNLCQPERLDNRQSVAGHPCDIVRCFAT